MVGPNWEPQRLKRPGQKLVAQTFHQWIWHRNFLLFCYIGMDHSFKVRIIKFIMPSHHTSNMVLLRTSRYYNFSFDYVLALNQVVERKRWCGSVWLARRDYQVVMRLVMLFMTPTRQSEQTFKANKRDGNFVSHQKNKKEVRLVISLTFQISFNICMNRGFSFSGS